MLEMFNYDFMQNAIIAGLLVSMISGIIGSLIVVNRMVFLAGGIAHTSYGGIGLAVYFGFPIFFGATLFAVACALFLAYITLNQKENIDTFIGVVWAVGMAIGVVLIDLHDGYSTDLMSYLFGSILAVSIQDIYIMSSLFVLILLFIVLKYTDILAVSYDSQYASIKGINVKLIYTLILIFCALSIVVSIKVVGLILVIALLTIPIYISQSISNSLASMMFISGFFSSLFTLVGLYFSYSYNITSGASIILVSAVVFFIFLAVQKYTTRR